MIPPRIGVAGWSIPGPVADQLPGPGTHLERYAGRFNAAEINSSFHRPHRPATYARWAQSVPPDFRFAVKLPKTITHGLRLIDAGALIERFADEVAGLGDRRGPILVQLPPSLAFVPDVAATFFDLIDTVLGAPIVCEPRHPSWFEADADALLLAHRVARVAADPAKVPAAAVPGGWPAIAYFRLHGSPQIYRSAYGAEAVAAHAATVKALAAGGAETWTIYDNTASGAAMADGLLLLPQL
ncbi:MAG: hypothetical protein JWM75_1360 [Sphingomonas bacterium]|nr:hypothetical protein [Sphingomonas bacterium]